MYFSRKENSVSIYEESSLQSISLYLLTGSLKNSVKLEAGVRNLMLMDKRTEA